MHWYRLFYRSPTPDRVYHLLLTDWGHKGCKSVCYENAIDQVLLPSGPGFWGVDCIKPVGLLCCSIFTLGNLNGTAKEGNVAAKRFWQWG